VNGLSRAWELYKQSFAVLSKDGEMLIFPIASGVCVVLLAAGFFIPLQGSGTFQAIGSHTAGWREYAPLFLWYYLNYFLIFFFNSALIACALIRLGGGDPTVNDGLQVAFFRSGRIAIWALVAATVGIALSAFNNRKSFLMRIVGSALSLGWTMITYLILPVILIEGRGIYDSIYRSEELFKKQWGEQLIGSFGFGLLNFLLLLPGFLGAAFLWRLDRPAAIVAGCVYILMLSVVSSAVTGVFKAALYWHAAKGTPPPGFSAEALNPSGAWE
jgi:hypothetical protein